MSWYIEVWKKYAVFSGRARRKEFWYFTLFNILILIGLGVISYALTGVSAHNFVPSIVMVVYDLAVAIPSLAVTVRRLHDTSRSGWWILIALVPLIGAIILLIFYVTDSQPGENRYGSNPKLLSGFGPAPIG